MSQGEDDKKQERPRGWYPSARSRAFLVVLVFCLATYGCARILGPTRCHDGWDSPSIGIQGACSHHGGVNSNGGAEIIFGLVAGFFSYLFLIGHNEPYERWLAREAQRIREENKKQRKLDLAKKGYITCPECGEKMTKRIAKKGRFKGREFFGCTQYPRCTAIVQQSDAADSIARAIAESEDERKMNGDATA